MITKLADKFAGRRRVANIRAVEQVGDYYFDVEDEEFYLCTQANDAGNWFLDEFQPVTGPWLFRAACAVFLIVASFAGGLFWIFARTST